MPPKHRILTAILIATTFAALPAIAQAQTGTKWTDATSATGNTLATGTYQVVSAGSSLQLQATVGVGQTATVNCDVVGGGTITNPALPNTLPNGTDQTTAAGQSSSSNPCSVILVGLTGACTASFSMLGGTLPWLTYLLTAQPLQDTTINIQFGLTFAGSCPLAALGTQTFTGSRTPLLTQAVAANRAAGLVCNNASIPATLSAGFDATSGTLKTAAGAVGIIVGSIQIWRVSLPFSYTLSGTIMTPTKQLCSALGAIKTQ